MKKCGLGSVPPKAQYQAMACISRYSNSEEIIMTVELEQGKMELIFEPTKFAHALTAKVVPCTISTRLPMDSLGKRSISVNDVMVEELQEHLPPKVMHHLRQCFGKDFKSELQADNIELEACIDSLLVALRVANTLKMHAKK